MVVNIYQRAKVPVQLLDLLKYGLGLRRIRGLYTYKPEATSEARKWLNPANWLTANWLKSSSPYCIYLQRTRHPYLVF